LKETTSNSREKSQVPNAEHLVVEHGKGNKSQVASELTEAEKDKLLECGEFGTSNPTILQRTLWWIIALHFGFRARD